MAPSKLLSQRQSNRPAKGVDFVAVISCRNRAVFARDTAIAIEKIIDIHRQFDTADRALLAHPVKEPVGLDERRKIDRDRRLEGEIFPFASQTARAAPISIQIDADALFLPPTPAPR